MKMRELLDTLDEINETASSGASSSGGMATVNSGFSIGMKKRKKGSEKAGIYEDDQNEQIVQLKQRMKDQVMGENPDPIELVDASWSRDHLSLGTLRALGMADNVDERGRHGDLEGRVWHLDLPKGVSISVDGKIYKGKDQLGDI